MASAPIRQVASPRHIAGALITPKAKRGLGVVLRHAAGEPWSPQSVSTLKKSPSLSPYVSKILSPYTGKERSDVEGPNTHFPKRIKSARKLPWSDGGQHSSSLGICNATDLVLARGDDLGAVGESSQPSVDTPDRAEMLNQFNKKQRCFRVLGKGSFGTVVEAVYKGKLVAVKIVQPNPQSCQQMKSEMNCLKLLHPNIVPIIKVTLPFNGIAGVVIMERVPGYSLQKLLDHDLLKNRIEQRIRYSMQISSALAYCHAHGVLHLDVKPQNVLVDVFTDNCRLCDFGCSSLTYTDSPAENYSLQGTVGYAAPEILQGQKPSTAADVYSLGITMWQLMSGETPYKTLQKHAVIYKVVAAEYRPQLPTVCCTEDENFLCLVKKCWSQSPVCRPSLQEVMAELTREYKQVKP